MPRHRYTLVDARQRFTDLADALEHPVQLACDAPRIDAWRLSYAPEYGGIVIEEITNEYGAARQIGSRQRVAVFCEMLDFALLMIDEERRRRYRTRTREIDTRARHLQTIANRRGASQ